MGFQEQRSVGLISRCNFIVTGIWLGFVQGREAKGSVECDASTEIQSLQGECTFQSTILERCMAA